MGETTRVTEGCATKNNKTEVVYSNVVKFIILHMGFFYGIYTIFTSAYLITTIYAFTIGNIASLGVTAGAHRLWCHRAYKAKLPLRIFLCILNCISIQNNIYEWSRDHRVHHKYTETDADPHNIKRGFFFAHMGWLVCKKHPQVKEKGKSIYVDDLLADPVVRFQRRFYMPLVLLFSIFLPVMIPVWCWNENLWVSFFVCFMFRYGLSLHYTWLVNSAAHMYGDKPFEKNIQATENMLVSYLVNGEGWHNYHHVFPWDYAVSELGNKMNVTKIFIDLMAKIGQAYDLKTAHPELVKSRKLKTGDGSRLDYKCDDRSKSSNIIVFEATDGF